MKRHLVNILIVLVLAVAAVGLLQRRILYPRPTPSTGTPPRPAETEVLWLGAEADVEAWFLPPLGAASGTCLLFTHGNGELIDHWSFQFETPRRRGLSVLLLEYPGYGRSGGSPSQTNITQAIEAAHDQLLARADVVRVVPYGRSLGGGAACALTRTRDVPALILESCFTSVRPFARQFLLPGFLVLDPFDNQAALERYGGPVLVLHGERDQVVPVDHGLALARTTDTHLVRLPCGHNDCPRPWDDVLAFLEAQQLLDVEGGGAPGS